MGHSIIHHKRNLAGWKIRKIEKYNIIRSKPEVTDSKLYWKIFWNQIYGTNTYK